MLLVQHFLLNASFEDLEKNHGVYASFSKCQTFWSMNYDQIESKESDKLAQQCRGIILSLEDGAPIPNTKQICPGKTIILARPMDRFFNLNQENANVNWQDPNLSVLEKLDGTLCIVWYNFFTKKWNVGTRSCPEADILLDNNFTFRSLFEKALYSTTGLSFQDYTDNLNKEITYCYELTSPYNRIVVMYPDNKITLLSARLNSGAELDINSINTYGVPCVKSYKYSSIQDLLTWVNSFNPLEQEGVIVIDSNFNRVKVKNSKYVLYHKFQSLLKASERNCLELILQEKEDDVIPFLSPQNIETILKIKNNLQNFIKHYDSMFSVIKQEADNISANNKKVFAQLLINNYPHLWSAPLFQIYDKKCNNIKEFITKNKNNGSWSDSFLDKLLEVCKPNL